MAQLKDLIVNGATRLIGDAFTNKIFVTTLVDSSGEIGSDGQLLKSDGSKIVWTSLGGAAAKGVTDKTGAADIKSGDTNLITARAVYYGLPTINGAHNYTSNTTIFAPTTTGSNNQYLKSTGSGAPSWVNLPTGSTTTIGIVQLNSATNSTTTTQAATPSAVKAAYELANSYKGTVTSITLTAGTGISLDATGAITTSGSRTISLATINSSATTSTASPAHGGTFTAVDTVTVDNYGRVTNVNTKTVTLPTDTGVRTVEASTTNLNFKVNTNGTTSSIAIPTGKLILFGEKEYDGSEDVEIHTSDVGLSGAMTFRGKITSELSEGSTANVVLEGTTGNMTRNAGDVVLDTTSKEYVWDGSKWVALGLAADFALKTHVHGNISSSGSISATTTPTSGQNFVLTDSNGTIIRSNLSLGNNDKQFLCNNGSWQEVVTDGVCYGTCNVADTTAVKTVTIVTGSIQPDSTTATKPKTGSLLVVKFTYGNMALTPQIKLRVAGASADNTSDIKAYGSNKPGMEASSTANGWNAGEAISFIYDGSYWQMLDYGARSHYVTQAGTTLSSNAQYILLSGNTTLSSTTFVGVVNKAHSLTFHSGNGRLHAPILEVTTASYGETLPTTGTTGQLFFQLSQGSQFELPAGGTQGQVLVKSSNDDRDVMWGDTISNATNANNATNTTNVYTSPSTVRAYVVGSTVNTASFKPLVHNSAVYTENSVLFGAAWNDYAEFRKNNENEIQEAGRCVYEIGDGSLALTTQRLQRGCEIISDTFGFAIGQDKERGYDTPVAVSGRVLAYLYEDINLAKSYIGWPVCSGPNGTVSIMTEEEEQKYPSRIIGTISEIPEYNTWGANNINVNGRIWVKLR